MRRVLIESPLRGDYERNRRYLWACIRDSLRRGEAPFASHKIYEGPLDDGDHSERELGIRAGFAWADAAELVAVYEDLGLSEGMRRGIERAERAGQAINYRRIGLDWEAA